MFLKLFLLVLGLLSIAFAGFALKIIFKKDGQFSTGSVGDSKELKKKGIHCMKTEQKMIDSKLSGQIRDGSACQGCICKHK